MKFEMYAFVAIVTILPYQQVVKFTVFTWRHMFTKYES